MNQLEYLLFSKKTGANASSLFQRPVEIVRALQNHPSSAFYKLEKSGESDKDFNNLKANVSQLLNGKRTASNKLIESLIEVIRPLIDQSLEVEDIIEEIRSYLVKDAKVYASSDAERDLEELNERYSNSKTQVVFNARPEESYDNKRAIQFTDSILKSLSILDDEFDFNKISTRYEYHFSNSLIAIEFFDLLLSRALDIKGEKLKVKLEDSFLALNQKNFIKIYVVEDIFTVFPHTVFNHLSQDMCGFIFFSKDANSFSIAKMSRAALQRWFRGIYLSVKYSRQEISFERYLNYKANALIDKIGQELNTSPNRFRAI